MQCGTAPSSEIPSPDVLLHATVRRSRRRSASSSRSIGIRRRSLRHVCRYVRRCVLHSTRSISVRTPLPHRTSEERGSRSKRAVVQPVPHRIAPCALGFYVRSVDCQDVRELGGCGIDARTGKMSVVDAVDLLIAGTSCKCASSLNVRRTLVSRVRSAGVCVCDPTQCRSRRTASSNAPRCAHGNLRSVLDTQLDVCRLARHASPCTQEVVAGNDRLGRGNDVLDVPGDVAGLPRSRTVHLSVRTYVCCRNRCHEHVCRTRVATRRCQRASSIRGAPGLPRRQLRIQPRRRTSWQEPLPLLTTRCMHHLVGATTRVHSTDNRARHDGEVRSVTGT